MSGEKIDYAFAGMQTDDEQRRLAKQNASFRGDELVRSVLRSTGIGPGAKVLEVGCGAGDVTVVVADAVGPTGRIVAVDRDEALVASTAKRCADAGLSQVETVAGDFTTVESSRAPFDLVIGRLVLMYQPDPVQAVRAVARHVRSRGYVAFIENCSPPPEHMVPGHSMPHWPITELSKNLDYWILATVMSLGTQPYMGLRLPETFAHAGLVPNMDPHTGVWIDSPLRIEHAVMVATIRNLLPHIVRLGFATEEEIDIDTLADRMSEDMSPYFLVVPAVFIGAWAQKP